MMKLLAALAILPLAVPAPIPQHVSAQHYQHDETTIVRVECLAPEGRSIGTAVKIGHHTYITALHVVDQGVCSTADGPLTVTMRGAEDWALLEGPASNVFMQVSCRGLRLGKIYLARGFAGGGIELFAEPWLATKIPWVGGLEMAIGTAIPGMSGGPLIDAKGRIRGIINTRYPSMSLPLTRTPLC